MNVIDHYSGIMSQIPRYQFFIHRDLLTYYFSCLLSSFLPTSFSFFLSFFFLSYTLPLSLSPSPSLSLSLVLLSLVSSFLFLLSLYTLFASFIRCFAVSFFLP